jgi:hypothetical protein
MKHKQIKWLIALSSALSFGGCVSAPALVESLASKNVKATKVEAEVTLPWGSSKLTVEGYESTTTPASEPVKESKETP